MRPTLFVLCLAAALPACGKGGPGAAFPAGLDPTAAEKQGREISDDAAVILTVASALDDEATVHAASAAMADCKPGPDQAACKSVARANEVGRARPRREHLKAAVVAQNAVATALEARDACRARGDLACVVRQTLAIGAALPALAREVADLKGLVTK